MTDQIEVLKAVLKAAHEADWGQVVANGGPPCFHLEDGRFCLRAERWAGHGHHHGFVSIADLLAALANKRLKPVEIPKGRWCTDGPKCECGKPLFRPDRVQFCSGCGRPVKWL